MTRLIGSRWKRREACSRGVLIRPVSRAEFCIAQSFVSLTYLYYSISTDTHLASLAEAGLECSVLVVWRMPFRQIACFVLVLWRRGYTRSHSELGS